MMLTACCAALASCTPTYRVYNGGLESGVARTLSGPEALAPTEAGAVFETDYAPPTKNASYAGPTNRVSVDVPEALAPHQFVTLKSATAPAVYSKLEQAGAASAAAETAGRSDARMPRVMAGTDIPESMTEEAQAVSVAGSDWPFVAATSSGSRVEKTSRGAEVRYASSAVKSARAARGGLALGDSGSAQEAEVTAGVVRPAVINSPMLMERVSAPGIRTTSRMIGNVSGMDSAKEVAGPSSAQEASVPESPVGLDTLAASNDYRTSEATASWTAPSAPGAAVSVDTVKLAAERDMVRDVGNANYLIAAATVDGWLVFKRSQASLVRVTSDAVAEDVSAKGVEAAAGAKGPLLLGDSAGAQNAMTTEGAFKTATVESVFSHSAAKGLRTARWTRVPSQVTSAGPPTIYVMKEARLFDARGVERLIAAGVLRDRPKSGAVIAYRVHVLNMGEAAAADIKVLDRLDEATRLLVNSMATNSDAATARYFLESRAIEVALPRLGVGEYFLIEFFVEPVSADEADRD